MKKFSFVLDEMGYPVEFESDDVKLSDVQRFISILVNNETIPTSEKTEGTICIDDNKVIITGRVCVEIGDCWDNDIWEDFSYNIHISLIDEFNELFSIPVMNK